jgi:hypothetical protein
VVSIAAISENLQRVIDEAIAEVGTAVYKGAWLLPSVFKYTEYDR